MTGTWEAMTAEEITQHRSLKYLPAHGWDEYVKERSAGPRPLTSMGVAQREAFTAGVQWVKRMQLAWDQVSLPEAIWELRAGPSSIFYPLFEPDPSLWANCPRCDNRVIIRAQGECPDCQYDFLE